MKLLLVLVSIFALSCGSDKKIKENPTNCAVEETSEGVKFSCTDKDGKLTSGVVKHGEAGAKGEQGPAGEMGKGLAVVKEVQCKGAIEGWLEGSSYEVEVGAYSFETGAAFLSSSNKLMREKEVVNHRSASSFYVSSDAELEIGDGLFEMKLSGLELSVSSKGGVAAKLPCLEK